MDFWKFYYLLGGYNEKCNDTSDCDEEFEGDFLYDMRCNANMDTNGIKN